MLEDRARCSPRVQALPENVAGGAAQSDRGRYAGARLILATGCAGFIGSNFVHAWLAEVGEPLVNLDKLTYAGNLANLAALKGDPRHVFVQGDIADRELTGRLLNDHQPRAVINFSSESHLVRLILSPFDFI